MTENSLNPKRVLQDCLKYLAPIYLTLLLINSPLAISIFIDKLLRSNFIVFMFGLKPLGLDSLIRLAYAFFLFPYLQAMSILYIHHYSSGYQWKLSELFKFTFTRLSQLILGHFLVIFRLSIVFIIFSLAIFIIAPVLAFTIPSIGQSSTLLLLVIGFLTGLFYYSKLLLVPHFIAIERRNAGDSFIETLRLTKDNEIRIFLILLLGGVIPVISISYIVSSFSEMAAEVVSILYQPLILIYSVVVYKHLKGGVQKRQADRSEQALQSDQSSEEVGSLPSRQTPTQQQVQRPRNKSNVNRDKKLKVSKTDLQIWLWICIFLAIEVAVSRYYALENFNRYIFGGFTTVIVFTNASFFALLPAVTIILAFFRPIFWGWAAIGATIPHLVHLLTFLAFYDVTFADLIFDPRTSIFYITHVFVVIFITSLRLQIRSSP